MNSKGQNSLYVMLTLTYSFLTTLQLEHTAKS